jgi:hypothetical protein
MIYYLLSVIYYLLLVFRRKALKSEHRSIHGTFFLIINRIVPVGILQYGGIKFSTVIQWYHVKAILT